MSRQVTTGFWPALDHVFTGEAVLKHWERAMGKDFGFGLEYLRSAGKVSHSHPCVAKHPCGCHHRVTENSEGSFFGACTCAEADCPTFPLTLNAVQIYRVSGGCLADGVRVALGLETVRSKPWEYRGCGWSEVVGTIGPKEHIAIFMCALEPEGLITHIDELLERGWEHGLLLTPTDRLHTETVLAKTRRNGWAMAALSQYLVLEDVYRMRCFRSIEPVLEEVGSFRRAGRRAERELEKIHKELASVRKEFRAMPVVEPVEESVAIKLFALVEQLESETNWRKAPILQVFRLYCMKNLSRNQVARQCGCAPSLISLRLKQLEKKLGRKPAELRQFSDHFETIADSLRDGRARSIHRRSALDEPEEE